METALVSLICIALIVFGGMTMAQGFFTSVDASTTRLAEVGQRNETMIRTGLTPVSTNMSASNTLEVILGNSGQTKLADFGKWDVIVQYRDDVGNYYSKWLPYTDAPLADNQWQLAGILLNGAPEVIEPGVLNPEEQLEIRAQLNPSVGDGTINMIVIATPDGVTASTFFSG
jgi:archaeal flagellar protein FlaF